MANPKNLKTKTIGGKKVVLGIVPASKARKIQTMLLAMLSEPLADVLAQKSSGFSDKMSKGDYINIAMKGLGKLMPKLKDGDLDDLIEVCKEYIFIDGEEFNEDEQFDADSLMVMYEILFYFVKETFGVFIKGISSRFPQVETEMMSEK